MHPVPPLLHEMEHISIIGQGNVALGIPAWALKPAFVKEPHELTALNNDHDDGNNTKAMQRWPPSPPNSLLVPSLFTPLPARSLLLSDLPPTLPAPPILCLPIRHR
ncbi:hypothetical protein EDB86DRAFT_3070210 [Lactarius hatsudake]|nr:hypothetical protein EDB86DRAFT_3070210 [Lactarius hatsudake]